MATDKLRPGGVEITVVCVVFIMGAALTMILRMWARKIKRVHLIWNDYLIIPALVRGFPQTDPSKLILLALLCHHRDRDIALGYVL